MNQEINDLAFSGARNKLNQDMYQSTNDPKVKRRIEMEDRGIVDVANFDGVTDAKKAALLSIAVVKKGKYTKGVVGQYPFYAPDSKWHKPAPKASEADKLLLWMFTATKANSHVAQIPQNKLFSDRADEESPDQYSKRMQEELVHGKTPNGRLRCN